MRLGTFYNRMFEKYPWGTLAVTNGLLTEVADGLAQTFDRRSEGCLLYTSPSPRD